MTEYRVIDLRPDIITPEQMVQARSPEEAARQVLGIDVMRSGPRADLVARAYWKDPKGQTTMVRLYGVGGNG